MKVNETCSAEESQSYRFGTTWVSCPFKNLYWYVIMDISKIVHFSSVLFFY